MNTVCDGVRVEGEESCYNRNFVKGSSGVLAWLYKRQEEQCTIDSLFYTSTSPLVARP